MARQASGRESTHGLKVLDGFRQRVALVVPGLEMAFAVGRPLGLLYVMFGQAALAACLLSDATKFYAARSWLHSASNARRGRFSNTLVRTQGKYTLTFWIGSRLAFCF